jgi:peptide/nickel transport system substrate-binding protein
MNRDHQGRLDEYRLNHAGPLENDLIDVLAEGGMDRQEFIKRATVLGLSAGAIGAALGAYGTPLAFGAPVARKAGGRIRVGITPPPTKEIEPHTFADQGGLETGGIAGEFLTRATQTLTLKPELALSWTPNAAATVWTFKLRPNVKFQSGQAFGADDVVATFKRLTDPNSGSQALSAFKGVLSPGGIKAVDNLTVQFTLDAPTASFPYLTSSTTYQAIVLPADYKLGSFTKTAQTTGAFRITSYTPGVGAKYDRNTGWWGGSAALDGVDVTYYADEAAMIAGLLGGQIDLCNQVQFATGRAVFNNSKVQIFSTRGATHREICLRVNLPNPIKSNLVRQAMALTLDRPSIVKKLFNGFADVGNDSPFAPVYPSTNKKVPQRHKDMAKAKKLLAQAGYPKGFSIKLTTEKTGEIPQLAQIFQSSVKSIGINMSLEILTATAYFAGTQTGPPTGYGNTPWLNAPISITDWGHRAVPNVYLTSAVKSGGVWNGAQYKNPKLDKVIDKFLGAISVSDQNKYAFQIQTDLLRDTPIIFPYFYNYIAAGAKNVKGYQADALGQVFLSHTSLA